MLNTSKGILIYYFYYPPTLFLPASISHKHNVVYFTYCSTTKLDHFIDANKMAIHIIAHIYACFFSFTNYFYKVLLKTIPSIFCKSFALQHSTWFILQVAYSCSSKKDSISSIYITSIIICKYSIYYYIKKRLKGLTTKKQLNNWITE